MTLESGDDAKKTIEFGRYKVNPVVAALKGDKPLEQRVHPFDVLVNQATQWKIWFLESVSCGTPFDSEMRSRRNSA